MISDSLRRKEK